MIAIEKFSSYLRIKKLFSSCHWIKSRTRRFKLKFKSTRKSNMTYFTKNNKTIFKNWTTTKDTDQYYKNKLNTIKYLFKT
jgi:hypothetical protein